MDMIRCGIFTYIQIKYHETKWEFLCNGVPFAFCVLLFFIMFVIRKHKLTGIMMKAHAFMRM